MPSKPNFNPSSETDSFSHTFGGSVRQQPNSRIRNKSNSIFASENTGQDYYLNDEIQNVSGAHGQGNTFAKKRWTQVHGQNDNTASFGSGLVYSGEPPSETHGFMGDNAQINLTQETNAPVSENANQR